MKRLLIIDDEPNLVDGLSGYLSEILPSEVDILKAYNVVEAVSLLRHYPIDLIISDIKMPGLTGMDLLNKIEYICPYTKTIFLTGYSKFEWIQKAFQHPNCVDFVLKSQGDEVIGKSVLKYLGTEHPLIDIDTLRQNFIAKDRILQSFRKKYSFLQWFIGNDDMPGMTEMFGSNEAHFVFAFMLREQNQTDEQMTYEMLEGLLDTQFDTNRIFLSNTTQQDYFGIMSFNNEVTLSLSLFRARFENLQNQLGEVGIGINCAYQSKPVILTDAKQRIQELMAILHSKSNMGKEIIVDYATLDPMIQENENSTIQWVCQYIQQNISDVNLSLTVISEKTFYTSPYLSRLFKQEKGITLSSYIMNVRMKKACALLKEKKRSVHEISRMVGFESPCYFSSVFKKQMGLTPVQFMRGEIEPL